MNRSTSETGSLFASRHERSTGRFIWKFAVFDAPARRENAAALRPDRAAKRRGYHGHQECGTRKKVDDLP